MRKLKLIIPTLFLWHAISAQSPAVVVRDTIHYFANKLYFKTDKKIEDFPEYKAPGLTFTAITHVGNIFENNEPLEISGISAIIRRNSSQLFLDPFTVRLYLCNIDNNGHPVLPPIDSVGFDISGFTVKTISGALTKTNVVNGNYAILYCNTSKHTRDTIAIKRTAGMTASSNADPALKTGEGYGVLRHNGQFYKTTNYSHQEFGAGTDYEFCLAPIVQYTLHAGHTKPQDTLICTHQQVKYISNSSRRLSSRFYNLAEFKKAWAPFHPGAVTPTTFPAQERGIAWHFLPDNKLHYLPPGSDTLVFYTDSANKTAGDPNKDSVTCFGGNQFRATLYGMNIYGGKSKFSYTEPFKICTSYCGKDALGLPGPGALGQVRLFPNPSNGNLKITGLPGDSRVEVFDMTGRPAMCATTVGDTANLDISGLHQGVYLVRVSNGQAGRYFRVCRK